MRQAIRLHAIVDLTGRLEKNLPLPIELLVSVPFPTGKLATGIIMIGADGHPALVTEGIIIRYYDILPKYGDLTTGASSVDDPILALDEVTIRSLVGVSPTGEVVWETDGADQKDPYGIAYLKKHHKDDPLALRWIAQCQTIGGNNAT